MLKVKGYIKQWLPVVVFLLITTACSEEGDHLPDDGSGARIPLKVSALLATSDSNATEEEMSVYSAFVFIYNTNGHLENAGKTEVPVNRILPVDKDGNINISYEWLVRAGEKDIYVVLNPPVEVTESLKQTLTISQLRTLIASDFSIYDNDRGQVIGGGLMTGHLNIELIASNHYSLPIRVARRYARLELYFKKSQELASVETKVSKVTLKNYSSEVMLFESYPEWGGSQEGKEQRGYREQIINNTENYVRLNRNFYMMPRPVQASITKGVPTVEIEIPVDNGMVLYQIPLAELDDTNKPDLNRPLPIQGNTIYRLNVTLTPKKEDVSVDISVLPWEEDTPQQEYIHGALSEHTNCYVVDPGGTVRISTNSVYRIWNWFLHEPIPAGSKVEAELIWSDTPGLISSVTVEKGYDMMSQALILVKAGSPSLRGNAVIGMKVEGERDYRWSWHVWVTDTKLLKEASAGEADVLSVILGFLGNENENKDFGLLYQWGRKDPFPNPVNGQPQLYGKTDTEHPVVQIQKVSEVNNIRNAIRNPLVFYTSTTSPYDWSTTVASEQDAQLWRDMDGFKSIYDPCPYGWRVASKEDLPDPISNNISWGEGDVRILIQEFMGQVHYPCAGYQDGQSGALQGQNSELCYWTSSKGSPQAYGMYGKWGEYNVGGKAAIDHKPTNRANGYSVRCVRNN